jgi:hypothetical protein
MNFAQKGGWVKHDAKVTNIMYYDGDFETTEMNDAFHSTTLFNNAAITQDGTPMALWIGTQYNFTILSYHGLYMPKYTNNDIFFLRLVVNDPTVNKTVRTIPQ